MTTEQFDDYLAEDPDLNLEDDRTELAGPHMKAEVEKKVRYPKDQLAGDDLPARADEFQELLRMAPHIP